MMTSDEPMTSVARRLGVSYWTLRGWYREAMSKDKTKRSPSAPPKKESDKERADRLEAEVRTLRKRLAEAETDKAILKKAAAFFARESE